MDALYLFLFRQSFLFDWHIKNFIYFFSWSNQPVSDLKKLFLPNDILLFFFFFSENSHSSILASFNQIHLYLAPLWYLNSDFVFFKKKEENEFTHPIIFNFFFFFFWPEPNLIFFYIFNIFINVHFWIIFHFVFWKQSCFYQILCQ